MYICIPAPYTPQPTGGGGGIWKKWVEGTVWRVVWVTERSSYYMFVRGGAGGGARGGGSREGQLSVWFSDHSLS
jgi:hypothetical protein